MQTLLTSEIAILEIDWPITYSEKATLTVKNVLRESIYFVGFVVLTMWMH